MAETKTDNYDDYQVGDRVSHPKFGDGIIMQRSGAGPDAKLSVTFVEEGEKKLMARYAKLKRLSPIGGSSPAPAPAVAPVESPAVPTKEDVDLLEDEDLDDEDLEDEEDGDDDFK